MSTDHSDLEPIEPNRAQELYLQHKQTECVEKTVRAHRSRTGHFVRWCDEQDIENLNALTGRNLQEYRLWRQEDGDLKKITLNQQMSTIRVFLKWCASVEAVPPNLYEKVMVPRVKPSEERCDETLDAETAETALEYLEKYHYASVEHAVLSLLWETGIRLGAANSLDVEDFDAVEERIDLRYRPDQGTQLKNGENGERPVALSTDLSGMLEDYVANVREDVTDDFGRNPLFSTVHGRMGRTTLRRIVYRTTAPCFRGEPCPDCASEKDSWKCGESVSPHAVRRGSITHFLSQDVPAEIVGDRMNVSRDVLDKHYDKRSEEVKLEQRRGYLENI